jgi:pantothenate kinase
MPVAEEPVEETLPALIERVRALMQGERRILGVTGPPGAGKSTLVEVLGRALGPSAGIVGMDGFHLANAELERLGRRERKGAPDTFDSYGYASLLARLRANVDPVVYAPQFRRDLEESLGSCVPIAREVPLVITEGNYLLLDGDGWPAARRQLDQVWYLDLAEDVRTGRLTARHEFFGRSPDVARNRVLHGVDGENARLVASTRHRADLVLRVVGSGPDGGRIGTS